MIVIYEGATARLRNEHNNLTWLAWHTATFMRAKRIPDLKKLIRIGPKKPQTPEQQEAIVRMMHAALTGKTRH